MTGCDPTKFPQTKYFNQHELPPYGPVDFKYKYTRCFTIVVDATGTGGPAETLSIAMTEPAVATGQYPGTPYKEPDDTWQEVIKRSLPPPPPLDRSTPLDMKLWFPSRIAMILVGDYWQFSRTLAPITTKHQFDARYFDLRMHGMTGTGELISHTPGEWQAAFPNGDCRCISFFAQEPCRDSSLGYPKVSHGFSLNIEVLSYDQHGHVSLSEYLPITIDPDIENKGGGPPP